MTSNIEMMWDVVELHKKFIQADFQRWITYELFSWSWWLLVLFLIIPWIIWIKFFDRKRFMEIILFGALTVIPTTYLDAIGSDLGFWIYPTELIPITPRAIAFDMSLVAITYMLLYQYFTTWKSFLIAQVIMALLFAFVGEPLSHTLNLVLYMKWVYLYSFIYYIIIGIASKAILEKAKQMYPPYNS
ncbi:CBO0543 family protein [Radiobacillus sp. PE A8.2]|uniref:CBO0543 family protein n=1 Tax=Radiobacillus sp. PE A8.2 TaxID=3380349 RepID=UPI00388F5050